MKNKFLLLTMFLLLLIGFYVPASYSAYPTYTLTCTNDVQTAPNVYRFDIYLLRTGSTEFRYFGAQIKFTLTATTLNGGTLTPTWLPGSNDPVLVAASQVNTLSFVSNTVRVISPNTMTYGTCAIISGVAPGTKLGTLVLTNSVPFNPAKLNLAYGYTFPATAVYAYNTDGSGISQAITVQANNVFAAGWSNPLLPVELSSFTSTVQGRTIVLNWSTKTEKNSDRFDVERSLVTNGSWVTVASVKASVLSNSPKSYSYSDTKLQSGKYQYRLKMIDNDGTSSYSSVETAEVAIPKDFAVSQNYPNPFNPTTKIDYQVPVDAKVVMEVYNIAGQKVFELVNQQQSAGYYTVDFGASKLSSGVYIYRLAASDLATGNNFSSIKKMMLLK